MSTRNLASELNRRGHRVSPWTVTNLLSEQGFSLQASPGKLSESRRSSKDAQFACISEQATAHLAASQPVIVFNLGKRAGGTRPAGSPDGWVNVRPDGDTAMFALITIRTWWQHAKHLFQNAERLLLIASRGASADVADHLVRSGLPAFAEETGIKISMGQLPAATVRWNKVEERICSHFFVGCPGETPARHEIELSLMVRTPRMTQVRTARAQYR